MRFRLFVVVLAILLVATLLPVAGARREPVPRRPMAVHELDGIQGDDACGLLSDEEILKATGAVSVNSRTPGPAGVGTAGCHWQMELAGSAYGPGELWVDVQPSGGRAMFELLAQGEPRIGGIGDGALEFMGALYAVKGDTLVYIQYLGFGDKPRPSSFTARALIWLITKRLSTEETAVGPTPTPGPTPPPMTAARASVERLRAEPFGQDNVDAAIELLARSGIGTYESPTDAQPIVPVDGVPSPMVLLRDQVRAMALEAWAGSGTAGEDLDALVPAEPDLAPASYVLAGYVGAVDTEGAQVARALMGDQDWAQAPRLVFPQLVLTLFASDLALDRMAEVRAQGPQLAQAAARSVTDGVRTAQVGLCSAVSNFISGALAAVFNALRLGESGGGSIFRTIWNFVVTIAETVVTAILQKFSDVALRLIGEIAGTVALVATIVSAIRPWTVTVTAVPPMTEKGVGGSPGQAGQLVVRVNLGGRDEWPTDVKDCAERAGRPLPNLKPEGAPVTWEALDQAPDGLVAIQQRQERLDAEGVARLDFMTLVDEIPAPWESRLGLIRSNVTVERPVLKDLATTLAKTVTDQLLAKLPSEIQPILDGYVSNARNAVIQELPNLLSKHASEVAPVIYHTPATTPPPDRTPEPAAPQRAVWVHVDRPAFGTVVEAGRLVELMSCSGPYGPWSGVLRFGGIGDLVPWSELPVGFAFRAASGVQRTQTAIGGTIPWTLPGIAYQADIDLDITVDGRFMTLGMSGKIGEDVVGNELLAFEGGDVRALPIEPAPDGTCQP